VGVGGLAPLTEDVVTVYRVGRLLLGLGVLVGAAAGIGLLVGFEPARLPPALLNIAVYKLLFVSAMAILAAGAVVLRHAGRAEGRARGARPLGGGPARHDLGPALDAVRSPVRGPSDPPPPLTPGEGAAAPPVRGSGR
jgi:hypothetical protein